MDTRYPSAETVFEYTVDPRNKTWASWESRLPQGGFKAPADVPAYRCAGCNDQLLTGWFPSSRYALNLNRGPRCSPELASHMHMHRLLVPTVDTLRNKFAVGALVCAGHHALVI